MFNIHSFIHSFICVTFNIWPYLKEPKTNRRKNFLYFYSQVSKLSHFPFFKWQFLYNFYVRKFRLEREREWKKIEWNAKQGSLFIGNSCGYLFLFCVFHIKKKLKKKIKRKKKERKKISNFTNFIITHTHS